MCLCSLPTPPLKYRAIRPVLISDFMMDSEEDVGNEIRQGLCIDYLAQFQKEIRRPDILPIYLSIGELGNRWKLWKFELRTSERPRAKPKISFALYRNPKPQDTIKMIFDNCKEDGYTQYLMVYIVPTIKLNQQEWNDDINCIKNCRGPIYWEQE
jgi:hypothetical protein